MIMMNQFKFKKEAKPKQPILKPPIKNKRGRPSKKRM
jgi:hypothetical protein